MRIYRSCFIIFITFMLTACAASLLVGNAQSRLLWGLLKPLVGFNPYEIELLEHPFIKTRMQSILGSHYDTTIKLLNTATELQQEGALFYIASRYAPAPLQQYTDKAALVWNGDTNQLAVLLIQDGLPQVFAEPVNNTLGAIVPTWPQELQLILTDAENYQESLRVRTLNSASDIISDTLGLSPTSEPMLNDLLKGKSAADILNEQVEQEMEFLRQTTAPTGAQTTSPPIPQAISPLLLINSQEALPAVIDAAQEAAINTVIEDIIEKANP